METTRNIAPMKLELLLAVVHNNKSAYFQSLIQSHKANLQLTMPAKGTTHLILDYLGLTERPKTLIVMLDDTFRKGKDYKGIAFTVPFSSVIGTLTYGFLSNDKRTVKEEA